MKSITVSAEVSGTVWQVAVEVGETVRAEQDLVILEAMKMEIPAAATHAGVVRKIFVEPGQAISEGQELVLIDSPG